VAFDVLQPQGFANLGPQAYSMDRSNNQYGKAKRCSLADWLYTWSTFSNRGCECVHHRGRQVISSSYRQTDQHPEQRRQIA